MVVAVRKRIVMSIRPNQGGGGGGSRSLLPVGLQVWRARKMRVKSTSPKAATSLAGSGTRLPLITRFTLPSTFL
ncbi:hypothetical protein BBD39_05620 [Arsenophonus endosymbiont of Bemisia tabaci Asia II 3]|nr:hypothetical protein BBD39_05620 [Arsenophonus endosymbiont of Bemisia tabaci Asia II 3]